MYMTEYYDVVLGLIPIALVGITLSLLGLGLEPTTAVFAASLAAVSLIGHAMFVRSPVHGAGAGAGAGAGIGAGAGDGSGTANKDPQRSSPEFQSAD